MFKTRIAIVFLTAFILLSFCSCALTNNDIADSDDGDISALNEESDFSQESSDEAEEELWNGLYVIFRSGIAVAGVPSNSVIEDATKYKDYVSVNAQYNTYTYFSKLGEREQWIYRIFEYAFDNNYSNVWFEDGLIENLEVPYAAILYFLSLDSPLVEQNMELTELPFEHWLKDENGDYVRDFNGKLIYINTFFENKKENKEEAIEKAESIINSMPESLSDSEKIEFIYRYLGENVEYYEYGIYESKYYLYDALCKGASNCDGFANAFSMLCNLAGVPCVEKMHWGTSENPGHTWNSVFIDGEWYNVDATAAEMDISANLPVLFYCGFPDSFWEKECEYKKYAPECKNYIYPIDASFSSIKDKNFITEMVDLNNELKRDYYIISFKRRTLNEQKQFQLLADALERSFDVFFYEGDGCYCAIIFFKNA